MNTTKIYLKTFIVILAFVLIIALLYKQSYFNIMQIGLGLIGMCIATVIVVICSLTFKVSNDQIQSRWNKFKLLFKVRSIVHKQYDTRMIDTVFAYFVHYYETNAKEIENDREFPIEEFPEGRFDLVKVYSYIKELKNHNSHSLNKLDYNNEKVFIYGMPFSTFKYTLKHNQLVITGWGSEETMTYIQYSVMRTKIDKALYDLDTEIASWIIKNRNHFGF